MRKTFCFYYPNSKVLSWSWGTLRAGPLCSTARARATSRWSSSCWITMPMPMSSECLPSSQNYCSTPFRVFHDMSFMQREPGSGFTPLMEAAASGHEIIVQYLLDHVSRFPSPNTVSTSHRQSYSTRKFARPWGWVMHKQEANFSAYTEVMPYDSDICYVLIIDRKLK